MDGLSYLVARIAMPQAPAPASSNATATPPNRAAPQGGIIEGANPTQYNPKDPITLFFIQAGLIIILCHILHWPLSKIRQPRVIAEVIGGILLGPSVMGRIPNFTKTIFPPESIQNLSLAANLGLVLFLFMIGLETDTHILKRNWRVATSVAVGGISVPFAAGCGLAWGVYNQFADDEGILAVGFPVFMLFIGVAVAITAFPVLCRILTELKLLDTPVGLIVLSAGVANDVVGWILLALCVTLVNAGNGITTLYILLTAVAFIIFQFFAVRPVLSRFLHWSGSIENGPSQTNIALILLITFASAFFTGVIGIHPIFGAFTAGLIIPREGNFTIKVAEKLEDLVGAIFLPLYFTLSGLNTNIGALNTGMAWAYVIATTLVAFASKVTGATLAARLNGLLWRESFTIGGLMSCKGLVELIVLNVGLSAKILSTRTFTIFVIMALLTTFAATPMTTFLFPPWYQKKLDMWRRGEIDWDTGAPIQPGEDQSGSGDDPNSARRPLRSLFVYLRLDSLPSTLGLLSMFGRHADRTGNDESKAAGSESGTPPKSPMLRAHGMRLTPLQDRDSSVMTVAQHSEYSRFDPVVNVFRTVGQLCGVSVSGEMAVVSEANYAEAFLSRAEASEADLALLPWSENGSLSDAQQVENPNQSHRKPSTDYTSMIRAILDVKQLNMAIHMPMDVADAGPRQQNLLVELKPSHILLPYFGGPDSQLALRIVLQLCEHPCITATVIRIPVTELSSPTLEDDDFFSYAEANHAPHISSSISFERPGAAESIEDILESATSGPHFGDGEGDKCVLTVLGRHGELRLIKGLDSPRLSEDTRECLGGVASWFVANDVKTDLLITQAKLS